MYMKYWYLKQLLWLILYFLWRSFPKELVYETIFLGEILNHYQLGVHISSIKYFFQNPPQILSLLQNFHHKTLIRFQSPKPQEGEEHTPRHRYTKIRPKQ